MHLYDEERQRKLLAYFSIRVLLKEKTDTEQKQLSLAQLSMSFLLTKRQNE